MQGQKRRIAEKGQLILPRERTAERRNRQMIPFETDGRMKPKSERRICRTFTR